MYVINSGPKKEACSTECYGYLSLMGLGIIFIPLSLYTYIL